MTTSGHTAHGTAGTGGTAGTVASAGVRGVGRASTFPTTISTAPGEIIGTTPGTVVTHS